MKLSLHKLKYEGKKEESQVVQTPVKGEEGSASKSRISLTLESALKKRVERNMFKVSREFQTLKFSINKKLREIGADIPPEDGVPGDHENSQ